MRIVVVKTPARAQFCCRKPAGPVVDVNDIGRRAESALQSERGTTEESEAFVIVAEAIDARAREVFGCINQKSRRGRSFTVPDGSAAYVAGPFDLQVVKQLFAQEGAICLFVERQDEARVHVAHGADGLRQRARHIAQATGLGERHSFRRENRNAQDSSPDTRRAFLASTKLHNVGKPYYAERPARLSTGDYKVQGYRFKVFNLEL